MGQLYWRIAERNPYIALQCRAYVKRHAQGFLRKWWFLLKINIRNKGGRKGKYKGVIMTAEEAAEELNRYDVISFDLFDTLLFRPYGKPTDLFYDLEKKEQAEGFARERIDAERRAREKHPGQEDITFAQIYAEIEASYRDMQQKELDFEREKSYSNRTMDSLYQHARQMKKRVIIVSDMYLPKDYLEMLLAEKGFCGYEKIYVSSQTMRTKASGSMYRYVLDDLKIESGRIVHIGDDIRSDGNAIYQWKMGYINFDGKILRKIIWKE